MIKIKKLYNYNKITLDELADIYKIENYSELKDIVLKLIKHEKIKIIKSSGTNGKKPALYNKYTVIKEKEDNSIYLEELNYKIIPEIDVSYFKKNIEKYKENRRYILKLNEFLKDNKDELQNRISQKERSFQIWQEEKYLQNKGISLLKKLDINIDKLNFYETNEPLAYYSIGDNIPHNILIIENMDTFYTFRKHLMNNLNDFLGINIETVIYGKGKGIEKSINDFDIVVDEKVSDIRNTIYYLGDLDFEGIIIYENLELSVREKYCIKPFVEGYKRMIDKALENNYELQPTKENQNKNIKDIFLNYFDDYYKKKILNILNNNLYIPQEILNIGDLQDGI
ncbi:Wadjet anti-phage system protein JetD domain-containing protein [Clostridium tertium]